MLSHQAVDEFRHRWLPNMSSGGIDQLTRMLKSASPQLLRGTFSPEVDTTASDDYFELASSGCISTQAGWLHPATEQLHWDAGIAWLEDVVGVRISQSAVIDAWDSGQAIEAELSFLLEEERARRIADARGAEKPAAASPDRYRRNSVST